MTLPAQRSTRLGAAVAALAAALAAVLAMPALAPAATPAQRAEVHRVLAPMGVFAKAVRPRADALSRAVDATQATDTPCRQLARGGISAARAAGSLSARQAADANQLLDAVVAIDVLQTVFKPIDAPLSTARRAYRSMRVDDPVLHAGARAEGTQLGVFLRLARQPDIDFCGFVGRLATAGFKASTTVLLELVVLVAPLADLADPDLDRAKTRAESRMKALGAGPVTVDAFDAFPISAFPTALTTKLLGALGAGG